MIKTERQYQQACRQCQEGREQLQQQIEGMKDRGYEEDEIQALTACTVRLLDEGRQAIDLYRRLKAQDTTALAQLPLNRQLIGLRIFQGLSQSKMAARLGVSRSEVARDEKNEYPELTLQRYGQVLEALGFRMVPVYVEGDRPEATGLREHLARMAVGQSGRILIG
ncbi:MAG: hypothetical protein GX133_02460 [Syntrophomonadaceae bacterium]|nr:hypothetical protein [Syntrophomonadaceae bacterium]